MKKTGIYLLALAAALFAPGWQPARAAETAASSNANLSLARQLNDAFVSVAEQVSPSVVVIRVIEKAGTAPSDTGDGDTQDPTSQLPPELRRYLQSHRNVGQGSGIIIRADGFILTNGHVVENADHIEVRLRDGRIFTATVRGVDSPSDLAVIKIDAKNLPVAKLADSDRTRVGEFAIAIGAPFALDYSVTFGHVSAKDRSGVMDETTGPGLVDQRFIQTDANINPGNSGGPLVNLDGEVIGVNTLIEGLHTGIGFAIPSNLAREVADKLISDGKFSRSWLGIEIRSLRDFPEFRELVPGVQDGVVVEGVRSDGPAMKSDLQPSDVITAIDGQAVVTSDQLKDQIRKKTPGTDVALNVYRQVKEEGRQLKILVKAAEAPTAPAPTPLVDNTTPAPSTESVYGITASAPRRRVRGTSGVFILRVDPGSVAERCNIQEGDIVTAVDGQPVTSPKEFYDALKSANVKKGVKLSLSSRQGTAFEVLKDDGN